MTKAIILGLLLTAAVMIVAHLEHRFAPTEQALRDDPPIFQHPLACDVIVAQRGAGEPFVSRCYIRSSSQ